MIEKSVFENYGYAKDVINKMVSNDIEHMRIRYQQPLDHQVDMIVHYVHDKKTGQRDIVVKYEIIALSNRDKQRLTKEYYTPEEKAKLFKQELETMNRRVAQITTLRISNLRKAKDAKVKSLQNMSFEQLEKEIVIRALKNWQFVIYLYGCYDYKQYETQNKKKTEWKNADGLI